MTDEFREAVEKLADKFAFWAVTAADRDVERPTWQSAESMVRALLTEHPAPAPETERTTVWQINDLLGVNLWEVPSFRADVRIDFDEYGSLLSAGLLNVAAPVPDATEASEERTPEEQLLWDIFGNEHEKNAPDGTGGEEQ
jgi:hypothetical protein